MFTREPAVAGKFYPYNLRELKIDIRKFLDNADDLAIKGKIRGLICPHAGYSFSGQTAAHAYRQIEEKTYKTVVVIGPSHHAYFNGVSIQPEGYFRTPLGSVEIDKEFIEHLYKKLDFAGYVEEADTVEHSVEVEIPFLQYVLGEFKLVPIVMGNQSMNIVSELASALASLSDDDVLLVASSDLYHGNDYTECKRKVNTAVELIGDFDAEGFHRAATEGGNLACGYGPITTVMLACKGVEANHIVMTGVTNSSDVTGTSAPGRYVVGYSSFVIYKAIEGGKETQKGSAEVKTKKQEGRSVLTKEERETLLAIARRSIENAAKGQSLPRAKTEFPVLKEMKGAFVTIEKNGRLRGCIGYIYPIKPLCETINEMARQAAIADPRFPPLKENELDDIKIEISVLSPLKRIKDIEEIEVGKHGLYIVKGHFSGLLLPQVATNYGWDIETFLEEVSMKAGLPPYAWKNAELYIFEAEVFGEE
ncbi:hypothetical protein CH333_01595 [candidate division WOR-3 bacterium JGI_Cruoil_03_44_89]|uniref:MEMO1 family protein CH333_01595 n=1 Tax=candidate division WOR-3 bacterium JGI_Cruoil_03_44_89 TaxID=1973748 RepID=A0A235BYB8_UNCW3|nr:MAG: hypothetical protein CH333_01595 [candidate division WOR-3 bacterium JGI_Cruoil_03_44_89]